MWAAGRDGRCADGRRRLADVSDPSIRILNELGNGWTADVHPDDIERCLDIYSQAFNRREPFQMEYRVRRDGVAYRRVLDTGVPRFAGDRFSGYVGSTVDVAELTSSRTYVNITQLVADTHEGSGRDRRDAFASVVVNR
jgi:PAS domain-containing protein